MRKIIDGLKENAWIYYWCIRIPFLFKYEIPGRLLPDSYFVKKKFKEKFGFDLNLKNPKRLTEKMQYLKLNDRKDVYTMYADKWQVREFLSSRYGEEYLVPILFHTERISGITPENINTFPCVIKASTGCGTYKMLFDGEDINWPKLRALAKTWIKNNHYWKSQEWQYKNTPQHFLVEKLMTSKDGSLPNDYKLFYIEGKLMFVHVGVNNDPNGKYKIEYDANWKPLPFSWERRKTSGAYQRGKEIPKPASFDKMKEIGDDIAKMFHQVRVDFYDVDGKLYYGEITLCHGSGLNKFIPDEYDEMFGKELNL